MKDIVIIPCFRRPEFLGACLTLIQRANNWQDYHYLFAIDRGADKQNDGIIEAFQGEKTVTRENHKWSGNSPNLLNAYARAHGMGAEYIFLIEDDIFIGKDFFDYHRKVHEQFNPFFVTACFNQMDDSQRGDNPSGIFWYNRFQSLGVSFHRDSLPQIIAHANTRYYSNRAGYLRRNFPGSIYREQHNEQDGLICRIMERNNLRGIFPEVPRAFHAGFYGYNRPGSKIVEKNLTLQNKITLILEMSQEEMNKRAIRMKDIERCNLEADYKVDKFIINDSRY